MKQSRVILPLGTAMACIWLMGCSKSNDTSHDGAITADSGSEPVSMKMKWTTGKRYNQHMTLTQSSRLNLPQMRKPVDQEMTLTEDYSISVLKDLPDGGHEMKLTFTGVKMDNKMGGSVVLRFDSQKDPKQDAGNAAAPAFRKIIGSRVSYETDASGNMTKILDYNEFIAGLSISNAQVGAMLQGVLNKGMIKQMGVPGLGLPEQPVKIGDHWPLHLDIEPGLMGALAMDLKYTFNGWQQHDGRKCVVLGFVGDISSKTAPTASLMRVSIEKGTLQGDMWYDPKEGIMEDTITEQNMDVKIIEQGKSAIYVMKQKIEFKLGDITDIGK